MKNEKLRECPFCGGEMDKLFTYLADMFGCPCDFSPIDEEMWEFCGDTCQNDLIECWKRVAKMIEGRCADNEN